MGPAADKQCVLTCRSRANYRDCGRTPPASHVLRNCAICKQAVYMSEAGQKLERDGRIRFILCTLCALAQTTMLANAGKEVTFEMGPVCAAAVENSDAAKWMVDQFLNAVTKKAM